MNRLRRLLLIWRPSWSYRRVVNRCIAVLFLCITVVLCLSAILLAIEHLLLNRSTPKPLVGYVRVVPPTFQWEKLLPTGSFKTAGKPALLTFVVQKVVVNENRLEGYVLLQIPPGLRARIWDPEKKQQVLEFGEQSARFTAKADYANRDGFRITYAGGTSIRSETITFNDVFSPQRGFYNAWRSSSTVEIRGMGQQDRFPFDWYQVHGSFSVDLVDPFCLLEVTDSNQQSTGPLLEGECPAGLRYWLSHRPLARQIPLHVNVAAEPTMQGREITVGWSTGRNEVDVGLLVKRDGLVKLYTATMSLIPLALAQYSSIRSSRKNKMRM